MAKKKTPSLSELHEKMAGGQHVPPQAVDVERSVLGAVLSQAGCIVDVSEVLGSNTEIFYREAHGTIYNAALSLYADREPIDLLTVAQKLRASGELDNVGGSAYLVELTQEVVTTANVRAHALLILEKSILRRLIEICQEGKLSAYIGERDTFDILESVEREVFTLSETRHTNTEESIGELVAKVADIQRKISSGNGSIVGVPSGLVDLDNIARGWQDEEYIILAGRSSQGKTALALELARFAAQEENPVGIFSIEMGAKQLITRMICSAGDFSSEEYYEGKIDKARIEAAERFVTSLPITVDESPVITPLELRSKARRMKAKHGIKLLIVDYLQLIDAGKNFDTREQAVAYISRSLKTINKELKIPVIALSQLNRGVEGRADKCPVLSDLRESGQIEQDADKAIFIWRPQYYGDVKTPDGRDSENIACLSIAKHRDGQVKKNIEVFYNLKSQRFGNLGPTYREDFVTAKDIKQPQYEF